MRVESGFRRDQVCCKKGQFGKGSDPDHLRRATTAPLVAVGLAAFLVGLVGCSDTPDQSTVDRSVVSYVDQVDPAEQPIAEFTVDANGNAEGQVKVQVLSLEATGDVVLLRAAITPLPLADKSSSDRVMLSDIFGIGTDPVLSDVEHMVYYQRLGNPLLFWAVNGRDTAAVIPRGEPFLYWAYFDAPSDRVDQLDLIFNDAWPVVEDVPVVWS